MSLDFSNIKVLVVGDISLDIVENGITEKFDTESMSPIIKNVTKEYYLGMSGNVALNLKNLGADVYLSTVFKTDKYGKIIAKLLEENNIKRSLAKKIKTSPKEFTTVKKRIFANNKQIARIDKEKPIIMSEEFLNAVKEYPFSTDFFNFIIISDYNKGFINDKSWKYIRPELERINKSNIFFVDTKKENVLEFYKGMNIFPNRKELDKILNKYDYTNTRELLNELSSYFIVETRDKDGATIYFKDFIDICNAYSNRGPLNTYGAGDVFISAFSLYYYKFTNYMKALKFANYCCSIAVRKKGTINIELNEIIDFVNYNY